MNAISRPGPNEATKLAQQDTVLSPRFYTTDFEAMDRIGRVRGACRMGRVDRGIAVPTPTGGHFIRTEAFDVDLAAMQPDLRREFLEFLVSSVTAEFSGCVL